MNDVAGGITAELDQAVTEARCLEPGCEFSNRVTGWAGSAAGFGHAVHTGHPVEEIHTRRQVYREAA